MALRKSYSTSFFFYLVGQSNSCHSSPFKINRSSFVPIQARSSSTITRESIDECNKKQRSDGMFEYIAVVHADRRQENSVGWEMMTNNNQPCLCDACTQRETICDRLYHHEKEWAGCVQSDIRAFGIAGHWKATALKAEVWVETVTEGGRRFMAAGRKEEMDAARHRQENKREATRLGTYYRRRECRILRSHTHSPSRRAEGILVRTRDRPRPA